MRVLVATCAPRSAVDRKRAWPQGEEKTHTAGGLDARDAALRGCRTGGGCDHADPGGEGVRPAVGGACVSRSREQRCALDKMWRVGQDGATFCNAAAL